MNSRLLGRALGFMLTHAEFVKFLMIRDWSYADYYELIAGYEQTHSYEAEAQACENEVQS